MILVTGGTGFIGQHLVSRLMERGHKVRLLVRDTVKAAKMFPEARLIRGDILKPESLRPAMDRVKTVIHLAGLVSYSLPKSRLMEVNLEGTENLLANCQGIKRFIFSGSVGAMGSIKGVADEEYPCKPATHYGESKLLAEQAVLASGIPSVVLRLAPVYGAGSPSWGKNLRMLEGGFPMPMTENTTQVLHVSDAAQAFELAAKKGQGTYLIADKEPVPFKELTRKVLELLGQEPKEAPFWIVKLGARMKRMGTYLDVLTMNRHYSILKAKKELGFTPKANMEKELERMIKWYQGQKKHPDKTKGAGSDV